MPGIAYAGNSAMDQLVPGLTPKLLANSLSGTGIPPAANLLAGDFVVMTTKSTITSSSIPVLRMLLAGDRTAVYKEGTPVAGILGIANSSQQTNASGVATSNPVVGAIATGAGIPYPYSAAAMWGNDVATGRSYGDVITATDDTIFLGRLTTAGGTVTLTHQYDNTLGGITFSTTAGVTTYTINVTDTTTQACILILGPNEQDPLYNTTVALNATGPSVYFKIVSSFQQAMTGVNYSTQ